MSSSSNDNNKPKNVGVIGLGSTGLGAVKELKEAGISVKGFDILAQIGGRWASDPSYTGGVFDELHLNSTRRSTEFSDFPWNREDFIDKPGVQEDYLQVFPHHTEMAAYLQAYVDHFDLAPNLKLKTTVTSIQRTEEGDWKITAQEQNKKSEEYTFDGLILCTGGHRLPKNSLKDSGKLDNFAGAILHNVDLKSIKDFSGKRVLVVGSAVSGSDCATQLAARGDCQTVVNSVRHAPYHVARVSPTSGKVLDDIFWARLPIWLGRLLPESMNFEGLKGVIMENWPNQLTSDISCMVPNEDARLAGVGYTSGYVDLVREGKLKVQSAIETVQGNTVTFTNGDKEDFDVILCATGFEYDLSFMPKDVQQKILYRNPFTEKDVPALYKCTLVPGIDNLALFGYYNNIGTTIAVAEMQARYTSAIWSGKIPGPSEAQIQAGAEAYKKLTESGPHHSSVQAYALAEDLGDELGVTPSYLTAFWNAKKLLTGTLYQVYYRTNPAIDGPEKAAKAQERFDYLLANPCKPVGEDGKFPN